MGFQSPMGLMICYENPRRVNFLIAKPHNQINGANEWSFSNKQNDMNGINALHEWVNKKIHCLLCRFFKIAFEK